MTPTQEGTVQLHARDERAVLVGDSGDGLREVDPHSLALGKELASALHEWAKVAAAVVRSDQGASGQTAAVVSRRGLQLAGRVAAALRAPVGYVDPLTGEVTEVAPPEARVRPRPARPKQTEPTPWATGLVVTLFAAVLVVFAVLTLAGTLDDTSPWLAVLSNVVVTGGLLPSVWLARRTPLWRWVALGVAVGIAAAWVALPFIVFGAPTTP